MTGDPVRLGICHCLTCCKETGSVFMEHWLRALLGTRQFDRNG
jgi:hypothetical protein